MTAARAWIERLQLRPHPEGGWFRETYRSPERIARQHLPARFGGDRCFSTAIYFLLEDGDVAVLHRIRQDEGWHFYDGSPLTVHLISPGGDYCGLRLGRDLDAGQEPQGVAPAGWLFAATVDDPAGYSLVSCTVAPGFEFADFEMPPRQDLCRRYPHLGALIERLTR